MASGLTDVLFIAYYFPPVGGAGVQRSLKFARYLPDTGYRPIVVTGTGATRGRWEPSDDSLAGELGAGIAVHRAPEACTKDRDPSRLDRLLGRPSPFAAWWHNTVLAVGREAAAKHDPKLIYVSLSPYEGLAPALRLGAELDLPVVADLRDPWALDEVRIYPSRLHRRRELERMGSLLGRCARVIMNTPEAAAAVCRRFPKIDAGRVDWVTNGYDAEDFAGLEPRSADGTFRILHTGYLHTAMGFAHRQRGALKRMLDGELHRVDFLTRSHFFLLEALERLECERPGRTVNTVVVLAGVTNDVDERVAKDAAIAGRISMPGYLDHQATVREMVEADLLFLPMHDLPGGQRARIVPGKTYEYLAAGTPILAALPAGDAREFVTEAGAGRVVRPSDVAGMADALDRFIDEQGTPRRARDERVERFERRRLTAKLARHFDALLDSAPPLPASAEQSRSCVRPCG